MERKAILFDWIFVVLSFLNSREGLEAGKVFPCVCGKDSQARNLFGEAAPMDNSITSRLRELARLHSQSEISRKTGTSQSNISKYLRGTKPPLEFGAALIRGFDVNPAWLLTGEGAPYLSDVTADTAQASREVLTLIQAMNTIAHKRLGSLLGNEHKMRLRELDDALRTYEKVCHDLKTRFEPLHRKLLGDFQTAINDLEIDRATTIREAILQVARFVNDAELLAEFKRKDIGFHILNGDIERSLAVRQELVTQRLFDSAGEVSEMLKQAYGLAASLAWADRWDEAYRICRGALGFYPDDAPRTSSWVDTAMMMADIEMTDGRLYQGLDRFNHLSILMPQESITMEYARRTHLLGKFLLGNATIEELRATPITGKQVHTTYATIAAWTRDEVMIKQAIESKHQLHTYWVEFLNALLQAGDGAVGSALRSFRKFLAHPGPGNVPLGNTYTCAFNDSVAEAELLKQGDRPKDFLAKMEQAHQKLLEIPDRYQPGFVWRALHYRNVLAAIPENAAKRGHAAMRAKAKAYFTDLYGKGYACFREYVSA